MIYDFIRQFTEDKIEPIANINKRYFLSDIPDYTERPVSTGIFLGEQAKQFKPSLALLELLAKRSERKLYVDDKAEWLFLCGRDLFGKAITKSNVTEGLVLVQNRRDENLGLGKIIAPLTLKNKPVVKNILDRGDFLRREKSA